MAEVPARDDAPAPTTDHPQASHDGTGSPPPATSRSDRRVHDGSAESFPASDPPSYMGARAPSSGSTTGASSETRSAEQAWTDRLVEALDRGDVRTIVTMLAEDAVVRVGPGPLLIGPQATGAWLTAWCEHQPRTRRHIVDVRDHGDARFIELEVHVDATVDAPESASAASGAGTGAPSSWPEAISVRLRGDTAARLTVYGASAASTESRRA